MNLVPSKRGVWTIAALTCLGLSLSVLPAGDQSATRVGPRFDAQPVGATPQPKTVSVLVHLEPQANRLAVHDFAADRGGWVKYEYKLLPNVINLRGLPETVLDALAQMPGVVRVEEDGIVHAHMNDSTPHLNALQSQIAAAGLFADGAGVRVCILDTGIDSDHIMYSGRIDAAAGRDFVNNDNNPEDDDGHGSHVSGTTVGGTGITVDFGCVGSEPLQGMAPEATLIGIKVLDQNGSGSFSDVIAGIDYCADQTASGGRGDVINMSLGGGLFSGTCDGDSAAAAANAAVDAGVVVVSSSGNDGAGNQMGTPACGSKVIAVGATYDDSYPNCEFPSQSSFTFCTATNIFGQCIATCTDNSPSLDDLVCLSNASTELDVVAPGCITFSADYTNSPNGLVGFCGTSMASPHVAGLAALLLSADPTLTPAEIRQHIRDGAVDLGPAGFDNEFGFGLIDAVASLNLVGPDCTVNGDCDDLDPCTTDVCNSGTCSNTPIDCDDANACTTDSCSGGSCESDPVDCNDADPCTMDSCDTVSGCVNDPVQCPPGKVCSGGSCVPQGCDNDGTCEAGEDCNNCSNDCSSGGGGGGFCGDGVCQPGLGEDCLSCGSDCRGKQNGNPNKKYCCGDGDGQGPVGCNDARCNAEGFVCSDAPTDPFCCGDAVCEGQEDSNNCLIDCPVPFCGDGNCDPGEDQCSCDPDCGEPPGSEVGLCDDGIDNDCDAYTDCLDTADCGTDPACICLPKNAGCTLDSECCSGDCKNNGRCR